MTDQERAAMQQALEVLEYYQHRRFEWDYADEQAITALRAALAQQAESVAEPITDYWYQHYVVDGLCGLCGNRGVIDTRGTTTPAGVAVGGLHYCVCPNGQTMRRNKAALAEPMDTDCHTQGICQRSGYGIGRQSDPQIADRLARHGINPCPDCRGIGYDASGQLCWCQQNPSF